MKTYKQLMEVMSMSDMNKITGGTEAQRKIAQDRQRRREAKNKGFNPDKDVLVTSEVSNYVHVFILSHIILANRLLPKSHIK